MSSRSQAGLKGSLVADDGLGLRGRSWSHAAWNETDERAVDHAVGAIERVGVGWCTDGAGYPAAVRGLFGRPGVPGECA